MTMSDELHRAGRIIRAYAGGLIDWAELSLNGNAPKISDTDDDAAKRELEISLDPTRLADKQLGNLNTLSADASLDELARRASKSSEVTTRIVNLFTDESKAFSLLGLSNNQASDKQAMLVALACSFAGAMKELETLSSNYPINDKLGSAYHIILDLCKRLSIPIDVPPYRDVNLPIDAIRESIARQLLGFKQRPSVNEALKAYEDKRAQYISELDLATLPEQMKSAERKVVAVTWSYIVIMAAHGTVAYSTNAIDTLQNSAEQPLSQDKTDLHTINRFNDLEIG